MTTSRLGGRVRDLLPARSDFVHARLLRDLNAGLLVAMVALPLALGFGVSSGVGAEAGLATAVVAGLAAAYFGGSRVQVSGPTGAMTVVLIPIVAVHGPGGVLVVGMLAGILLLGLAVLRAGRLVSFVPVPVVEGFTLGIAAVIALQQIPHALGSEPGDSSVVLSATHAVGDWFATPDWTSAAIAALTVLALLVAARMRPGVPVALLMVSLMAWLDHALGWSVATVGAIPAGLPAPTLPTVPWASLPSLVLPAIAVAALSALESLLSATVADGMSVGRRFDPDRELVGQGVANLLVPIFGGIPATGAIARTAVNARAGATSRLAAMLHAGILLVAVLVGSRLIGQIPLAALAGVLIATAVQMVKVSSVRTLARASGHEALVLVVTAAATLALDLVQAVVVGLVVAGFFALRQVASAVRLDEVPLTDDDPGDEQSLLDEHIVAYRLDGPLLFAAAHDFLLELAEVSSVRVVILRMSRVTAMDSTGASVLADVIGKLEGRGVTVMLSGVRPEHDQMLRGFGVYGMLAHERHLFAVTPEAIAHARQHASRMPHDPSRAGTGPEEPR